MDIKAQRNHGIRIEVGACEMCWETVNTYPKLNEYRYGTNSLCDFSSQVKTLAMIKYMLINNSPTLPVAQDAFL